MPNIEAMSGDGERVDAEFRFLRPDEGGVLSEAIRTAYGESYDAPWVYDEAEVSARLAAGTYVSCVAETAAGELLCHEGMSMVEADDAVGHSGQAVTMPAARGQHLFTRTKRFLMDWARDEGMAGMFSEATAAHPYSQRANVELGAHETGFLLGWIPASVANDAADGLPRGRQSAALFYTKLNDGHERPVYAPERHRDVIARTLELCELRGAPAAPPEDAELAERTELRVEVVTDHNLALITVERPGADLEQIDLRRAPPPLPPLRPRRRLRRPAAGDAGDGPHLGPPRAPRGLLRGRLPQPPRRRRRAADAVAAPCPDQGRRRLRRLRARPRAAGLRPRRPAQGLERDLAGGEVGADLALDALQGVVDRLRVALEPLRRRLVGVPVEVEGEDAALEVRENAGGPGEA